MPHEIRGAYDFADVLVEGRDSHRSIGIEWNTSRLVIWPILPYKFVSETIIIIHQSGVAEESHDTHFGILSNNNELHGSHCST